MSESQSPCERCGQPAIVHITNEIGHEGLIRHFCLKCADLVDNGSGTRERGLNHGAVLVVVGTFTLLLSLLADYLSMGHAEGFGWKQEVALALGLLLLGAGALIRASTLLVIGGLIALITLLAEWINLAAGQEEFGHKQITGSVIGVLMIAVGIARTRLTASSRSTDSPEANSSIKTQH